MELIDVRDEKIYAAQVTYELLKERTPSVNINHSELPSFEEHKRFLESNPYVEWFLVCHKGEYVGQVYLTNRNEVGIFLFRRVHGQGLGKAVLTEFVKRHNGKDLLANINPQNGASIRRFTQLGFRLASSTPEKNTYARERETPIPNPLRMADLMDREFLSLLRRPSVLKNREQSLDQPHDNHDSKPGPE